MPWIQLSFFTHKNSSDKAELALLDAGALSVTFRDAEDNPILEPGPGETPLWEDIILTGLFDADVDTESLKEKIKSELGNSLALKIEPLEDKDWVRAWMDDYKPMQFGERLWVCPKHLPPPNPHGINLMLDPGLAFGTGTHPTTALCLQWLDAHSVSGKQIIDFGCGSGVLAIAALLLGASHCDGVDIDPQAITASLDNAQANNVADKLNLYLPKEFAEKANTRTYDLVLANILAGPLTELAEQLSGYCKTGGEIVLSGILESQANKVVEAYSPWFELEPVAVQDEWIRVTGKKK
jgi:ribosomal protein L11 methyltransferase